MGLPYGKVQKNTQILYESTTTSDIEHEEQKSKCFFLSQMLSIEQKETTMAVKQIKILIQGSGNNGLLQRPHYPSLGFSCQITSVTNGHRVEVPSSKSKVKLVDLTDGKHYANARRPQYHMLKKINQSLTVFRCKSRR